MKKAIERIEGAQRLDATANVVYSEGMGIVNLIGQGYYAIEAGSVAISPDVRNAVNTAFEAAAAIPAGELNIRLSDRISEIQFSEA